MHVAVVVVAVIGVGVVAVTCVTVDLSSVLFVLVF